MGDSPIVHWFPGHMAKATRMIQEQIKKVDVVCELLDARIPNSSSNPVISELAGNKPHVVILNKTDLADPKITKEWAEKFKSEGKTIIMMDSISGRGQKQLIGAVQNLAKPILERWQAKGIRTRSVRMIILGIPNVGKSTLINKLAGTAATRTADKAGHTRGQQWVRIGKSLELLDTPGILWPKLEDQRAATRLAITGSISDDVYDSETVMAHLLTYMLDNHPQVLAERFKLKEEEMADANLALEAIGRRRGCLVKGGLVDLDKARRIVLADFRNGKWGLLSFDKVDEEPYIVEDSDATQD